MSNAALDRSEFLARRKTSLGGSDIAVVMGLSKYKTPMQLWQEKTGLVESEDIDSEPAYWGIQLEDLVAKEYAKRTGNKVQRVNAQLKHHTHNWMAGNIDRAVVEPGTVARVDKSGKLKGAAGILECKTASTYLAGMWDGDSAPVQYVAQCQWYMAITGAAWTDLAVLIGGQQFKIIRIEADAEIQQALIEAGKTFWNDCVLAGVPPAPQTSAEVIQLYPQSLADSVLASYSLEQSVIRLKEINEQIKTLEAEQEACKTEIQLALADKDTLVDAAGNVLVTWKSAKETSRTDWKAVAEAAKADPSIISHFTKSVPGSRRFLIK